MCAVYACLTVNKRLRPIFEEALYLGAKVHFASRGRRNGRSVYEVRPPLLYVCARSSNSVKARAALIPTVTLDLEGFKDGLSQAIGEFARARPVIMGTPEAMWLLELLAPRDIIVSVYPKVTKVDGDALQAIRTDRLRTLRVVRQDQDAPLPFDALLQLLLRAAPTLETFELGGAEVLATPAQIRRDFPQLKAVKLYAVPDSAARISTMSLLEQSPQLELLQLENQLTGARFHAWSDFLRGASRSLTSLQLTSLRMVGAVGQSSVNIDLRGLTCLERLYVRHVGGAVLHTLPPRLRLLRFRYTEEVGFGTRSRQLFQQLVDYLREQSWQPLLVDLRPPATYHPEKESYGFAALVRSLCSLRNIHLSDAAFPDGMAGIMKSM